MKDMKLDTEKILKRLESDYLYVTSKGYEVLGVFLQGSQNYGLAYENSDIDTKAIIIPSFEDFCLNKEPVSTTIILENNEHIDLKDIRLMWKCFCKQNINFVEILFTNYSYVNPLYKEWWNKLTAQKESIARYNNYAGINCIAGMSEEKFHALEHPYSGKIDLISKYGFDPKQLHHIKRLNEFIKRYVAEVPYADCLISEEIGYTIDLKRIPPVVELEDARRLAQEWNTETKGIKNEYMATHSVKINKEVESLLNDCLLGIMKVSFVNYLLKNQ